MTQKTISFDNKVDSKSPTVPEINDVRAADLNEIKGVVNDNASDVETRLAADSTVQNNIIYVAANGNDGTGDGSIAKPYLTPAYALSLITDSSDSNRYTISVGPGAYSIDNPLVLKEGVYIVGQSDDLAVVLSAQNASLNLVELANSSGINNATLTGATSAAGIYMGTAGSTACGYLTFIDCEIGIHFNDSGVIAKLNRIVSSRNTTTTTELIYVEDAERVAVSDVIPLQGTFTNVLRFAGSGPSVVNQLVSDNNDVSNIVLVENGADVTLMNSRLTGDLGDRVGTALRIIGDGSQLDCLSVYVQYADYGAYVDNSSFFNATGIVLDLCDIGVFTGTTGNQNVKLHGGSVTNSLTWDMYLSNSNATLIGSGLAVDEDNLYLDGARVVMNHVSTNEGDECTGIKGELQVGSPERPSETVLGEGDSYTRGLFAYSYNVTGAIYTDISEEVKSYTGSTFTFPNLLVDSAIYIGSSLVVSETSDFHKSMGIKMALTTAQVGGSIVSEYWNGSAWVEFNTSTTESSDSYYRKADLLFSVDPGSYQVRYNPAIGLDWEKNEPDTGMGSLYWVRYRIATALTTAPVFEQWKLHSNRTEFNGDGFYESMGTGRDYIELSIPWGTFQDSATKVGNQDLYASDNCNAGFINNVFDGAGDSVGTVLTLPSWVDTSAPLKLRAVLSSESSGTLDMKAFLNSTKDGETVFTAAPGNTTGEVTQTVSKTVVAGEQITYEFELDISDKGIEGDGIQPEAIWVNLEADALPGDVYGIVFDIKMLSFKRGSHV